LLINRGQGIKGLLNVCLALRQAVSQTPIALSVALLQLLMLREVFQQHL
jgi:hypothetical protein